MKRVKAQTMVCRKKHLNSVDFFDFLIQLIQ